MKFTPNSTGASVCAGKYYDATVAEIPAVSDGASVTEVAENAFLDKTNIKKIILPATITKIGDNAFNGMSTLESINIPDGVTYIGDGAFKGCKRLKTIVIPAKTKRVGSAAFSGCDNLETITIVAREGNIDEFSEDWQNGISASTSIKIGFVVNLDYNGATAENNIDKPVVCDNENYTLPTPKRNGYKFLGWYDSLENGNRLTDESGRSVSAYQKQRGITAYAYWEANLNSVIFDANGGNGTMGNQQIATDSSAKLNECAFMKDGYTFIGWGTTSTQKIYDDKAVYAMGTNSYYRLYAIWQANVNTLRFDTNGGIGIMSDMRIKTDETRTLTDCGFSRKGYDFVGWATSENGEKAYNDGAKYSMGTAPQYTLYADWSPIKYTITCNLNGGSVSGANRTEYTVESESFTLNNPTRPGYAFSGWTGTNLSGNTLKVDVPTGSTGNLLFDANFVANKNSLQFNANGGDGSMSPMIIETDETVALKSCTLNRRGYDFGGWATSANGEKVYSDGQKYTMGVNSKYVLYAVWKIKTYTIEYNLNSGTVSSNKQSYTVETESFTLENPLRDGYTFMGWSGTDIADKSTTVTIGKGTIGNRKYTANWKANTNVLHFNPNGGDGIMDDMSIDTDAEKLLMANTFTRDGYKFKGWATVPNGSVVYLDTSSYRMGTASAYTLYAVWEANINKLIFDGNGSTSGEMEEMSIKTDEFVNLINCGFTKTGYSFKGWATEPDGSVKYGNKAIYTMGAESSYTLYAVWEINKYTITLELNGGAADTDSITQNYNTVVEPPVVTRSGYNFVEWYSDSEFNTIYNFSTIPAENITVYAKWQLDTTYTGEIGIRNIQELQAINEHLSGKFYLESDINATGFKFIPLGNKEDTFVGTFDGNNKTITNLSISGDYYYAGLFGYSKAKIINVYLKKHILPPISPIINDKKECRKYINRLLNMFGHFICYKKYLPEAYDYRIKHILFSFGMGLVFADFADLTTKIGEKYTYCQYEIENNNNDNFLYAWLTVCLYHDFGYYVNRKKYSEISNISEILKKLRKNIFKSTSVSRYNFELYQEYYKERFKVNKSDGNFEIGDHGILGGMFLYDLMKKRKFCEYCPLCADICFCIMEHNIWKKNEDYPLSSLYHLIDKSNFVKINLQKEPLLFLLSLVDTIEPIKKFSKCKDSNSSSDKSIFPKTIAKSIKIIITNKSIVIDWNELEKVLKKRDNSLKINDWTTPIKGLSNWVEVNSSVNNNFIKITLG